MVVCFTFFDSSLVGVGGEEGAQGQVGEEEGFLCAVVGRSFVV